MAWSPDGPTCISIYFGDMSCWATVDNKTVRKCVWLLWLLLWWLLWWLLLWLLWLLIWYFRVPLYRFSQKCWTGQQATRQNSTYARQIYTQTFIRKIGKVHFRIFPGWNFVIIGILFIALAKCVHCLQFFLGVWYQSCPIYLLLWFLFYYTNNIVELTWNLAVTSFLFSSSSFARAKLSSCVEEHKPTVMNRRT